MDVSAPGDYFISPVVRDLVPSLEGTLDWFFGESISFNAAVKSLTLATALNCALMSVSVLPEIAPKVKWLNKLVLFLSSIAFVRGWYLVYVQSTYGLFDLLSVATVTQFLAYFVLLFRSKREDDALMQYVWIGGFGGLAILFLVICIQFVLI